MAQKHYAFMGHIVGRHIPVLLKESAPAVTRRLKSDQVDVMLLTPGGAICDQSLGLIQREIERASISTVSISPVRSISEKIRPPRAVFLSWPFGHPLGEPFNAGQQRTVLLAAINALQTIRAPGAIIDLPYRWRQGSTVDLHRDPQ